MFTKKFTRYIERHNKIIKLMVSIVLEVITRMHTFVFGLQCTHLGGATRQNTRLYFW